MSELVTGDHVVRRHSPAVRVLIAAAVVDGAVFLGVVAWNVVEHLIDRRVKIRF